MVPSERSTSSPRRTSDSIPIDPFAFSSPISKFHKENQIKNYILPSGHETTVNSIQKQVSKNSKFITDPFQKDYRKIDQTFSPEESRTNVIAEYEPFPTNNQ